MKKFKVLLVDDSPETLRQEKALLAKLNLDIRTATNGAEAIKVAHQEKPDLIFLDLEMDQLSGDAVCRVLRSDPKFKEVAIVVVTAKSDEHTMQDLFKCGCDAFVSKPFNPAELLRKLKVVMDEKEIYLDWDKLAEV